MKNKTILIIAAHPDDELLGCGATIHKYIQQGARAVSVILAQGMLSRAKKEQASLKTLREQALRANKKVGISKVHFEKLPDNQMDRVPLLKVVKLVEQRIRKHAPDIIFTHFEHDLNVDHRIVFQAVLTACRPQPGFKYPDIYSFEIPSSTDFKETDKHTVFVPNVHVDIKAEIAVKLAALKEYKTEMKKYPHSRSIRGVEILAQHRGVKVGLKYAESFLLVRKIEK